MRHFWNWVKNEDETRTLYLEGVIAEESWFADDVTPAMFKEELFSGDGPITLHINSPGGDCIAASQIYTMLMEYPHDVTVQIDGMAASAASVIAMAGTRVQMSPTSMMMVHNPFTAAMGDTDEMRKAIQLLDEVKEWVALAAAIVYGAVKLVDVASGAKAARETLEGMNKTAKEWKETAAETFYSKSTGLSFFGMSKEDFTRTVGSTKESCPVWRRRKAGAFLRTYAGVSVRRPPMASTPCPSITSLGMTKARTVLRWSIKSKPPLFGGSMGFTCRGTQC